MAIFAEMKEVSEAKRKGLGWFAKNWPAEGPMKVENENLRCYAKLPVTCAVAGDAAGAQKALNTLKDRFLTPEGDFRTSKEWKFGADAFNQGAEGRYLYSNGWIAIAAQINRRFDLAVPAINYILRYQDPQSGGVFALQLGKEAEGSRRVDLAATVSCGHAMLYCGRLPEARRAAEFLLRLRDLQTDPNSFYLAFRENAGLITDFPAEQAGGSVVRKKETQQMYWMPAFAAAFLAMCYQTFGEEKFLAGARDYYDFISSCQEDHMSFFGYWKMGLAASVLYSITREKKYQETGRAIVNQLVTSQAAAGNWPLHPVIATKAKQDLEAEITSELLAWLYLLPAFLGI